MRKLFVSIPSQATFTLKLTHKIVILLAALFAFLSSQAFSARAAEDSTIDKPFGQKLDATLPSPGLRLETSTVTNALPEDIFHLEFSLAHIATSVTNDTYDLGSISLGKRPDDGPKTSLGRFLRKYMAQVEDWNPLKHSGSHNKFQPNFVAGFGHLTGDDDGTTVTRGDNGTRQEPPAFLYLSSSIKF